MTSGMVHVRIAHHLVVRINHRRDIRRHAWYLAYLCAAGLEHGESGEPAEWRPANDQGIHHDNEKQNKTMTMKVRQAR